VWQPMLPTDVSAPTTGTLARLSDRRVRQYYDADHVLAKRMKQDARPPQPVQECCTRQGILWDLMAVYAPGEEWTNKLPTAAIFNGPVVDVTDGLTRRWRDAAGSLQPVVLPLLKRIRQVATTWSF
jgi:hypothetical protein